MDSMTLCDCCRSMAANRIVLENMELHNDIQRPIRAIAQLCQRISCCKATVVGGQLNSSCGVAYMNCVSCRSLGFWMNRGEHLSAFLERSIMRFLAFLEKYLGKLWKVPRDLYFSVDKSTQVVDILSPLDQRAEQYVSKLHERREYEGIGMHAIQVIALRKKLHTIEHVVFRAERGPRSTWSSMFLLIARACLLALFVFSPPTTPTELSEI